MSNPLLLRFFVEIFIKGTNLRPGVVLLYEDGFRCMLWPFQANSGNHLINEAFPHNVLRASPPQSLFASLFLNLETGIKNCASTAVSLFLTTLLHLMRSLILRLDLDSPYSSSMVQLSPAPSPASRRGLQPGQPNLKVEEDVSLC